MWLCGFAAGCGCVASPLDVRLCGFAAGCAAGLCLAEIALLFMAAMPLVRPLAETIGAKPEPRAQPILHFPGSGEA
jgi:hypothetical protein